MGMETRTGRCHCGGVVFEVTLSGGFEQVRRCDCSLCRRKGAIMAAVPRDRLRVVEGADILRLYQWNTNTAEHYFCGRCGIYTHHRRRSNPDEYGFNLGCFDDVDLEALAPVPWVRGSSASLANDKKD